MGSTPGFDHRSGLSCSASQPKFIYLMIVALSVCLTGAVSEQTRTANVNDFAAYWSAASLIIHGQNPYASAAVLKLEQAAGYSRSTPLIMRNPPWIVPIIAPLGFLPFGTAQRLWLIVGLLASVVSAKWLWDVYRTEEQSPLLTCLATATFSPIPVALAIGQATPLVLLGIAGFLRFQQKQKLGWAGAFLFLAALKPHLIFLVWAALGVLSIYKRSARILGGLILTTMAASLIAISLDYSIFIQYVQMLVQERLTQELTPTLSGLIRLSIGFRAAELLPGILALGWVFFYTSRRSSLWNWVEEMPILILTSLLTTPYAWFFDEIVLLPCLFQASTWLASVRCRRPAIGIDGMYLVANALVLILILLHRATFWYTWTAPTWFALFI